MRRISVSTILRCFALAAVLLLCIMQAAADDISIRIDRLAGTVEVMHSEATGGKWQAAERFQDIGPGWQLRTGDESKAMLVFPFGNVCILKGNSLLTVDKLDLKGGSKLKLDAGGLLADLRTALSPGSEFSVESASALATVRGTEFAVDYRKNDAGEPIVWFCCFRGAVELSNEHGPAQLLEAGKFVTVKPGTPIAVPTDSTPKAQDFMRNMADPAAFEAEEAEAEVEPAEISMVILLNSKTSVAHVHVLNAAGEVVVEKMADPYGVVYLPNLAPADYTLHFMGPAGEEYPAVRRVTLAEADSIFLKVELTQAEEPALEI